MHKKNSNGWQQWDLSREGNQSRPLTESPPVQGHKAAHNRNQTGREARPSVCQLDWDISADYE